MASTVDCILLGMGGPPAAPPPPAHFVSFPVPFHPPADICLILRKPLEVMTRNYKVSYLPCLNPEQSTEYDISDTPFLNPAQFGTENMPEPWTQIRMGIRIEILLVLV